MFKRQKNIKKSANDFINLWDTDFDDIWNIDDKNKLLIALDGWLCKKCKYGENIKKLSKEEKSFYFIFQLEREVNNGGFLQFFFNDSGDSANDTAAALREIGAEKTAKICDRALAPFGGTVSNNRDERITMLNNTFTDEISEIFSQCDKDFYKYADDLVDLNYQFIMKNKNHFTR